VEAKDLEAADTAPTEPVGGRTSAIQEAAASLEPAQGQDAAGHATEPDRVEVLCKGGAAASSGWEEWHKRNDSAIHAQDHQKQRRRRWHHLYNQMAQQITLNGRADETTAKRRHQHDKAVAAAKSYSSSAEATNRAGDATASESDSSANSTTSYGS